MGVQREEKWHAHWHSTTLSWQIFWHDLDQDDSWQTLHAMPFKQGVSHVCFALMIPAIRFYGHVSSFALAMIWVVLLGHQNFLAMKTCTHKSH